MYELLQGGYMVGRTQEEIASRKRYSQGAYKEDSIEDTPKDQHELSMLVAILL
jgi:hypothetical protein